MNIRRETFLWAGVYGVGFYLIIQGVILAAGGP